MARPTQLESAIAKLEDDKKKEDVAHIARKQKIQDVIDVLKAMNSKTVAEVAAPEQPKKTRKPRTRKGLPAAATPTFAPEQGETGGLL